MLQIILTLAIFLILVIPMGKYMYHIATKQKTFADKMFNPIDNFLYKICGIKREDMGWKKYAMSLVLANAVMVFIGYLILRLQNGGKSFLQYDHQFYDKYKPAALCRRKRSFLRKSVVCDHFYDVYLSCQRLCSMYGILPRSFRKKDGKLL